MTYVIVSLPPSQAFPAERGVQQSAERLSLWSVSRCLYTLSVDSVFTVTYEYFNRIEKVNIMESKSDWIGKVVSSSNLFAWLYFV